MSTKHKNVNSKSNKTQNKRRRNDNLPDELKAKSASFHLFPGEIEKLVNIGNQFGTLNKSHTVSTLIEGFSNFSKNTVWPNGYKSTVVNTHESISMIGNEVDINSAFQAYINLFNGDDIGDVIISEKGREYIETVLGGYDKFTKVDSRIDTCLSYFNTLSEIFSLVKQLHIAGYIGFNKSIFSAHTEEERNFSYKQINYMIGSEYKLLHNIVAWSPHHKFSIHIASVEKEIINNFKKTEYNAIQNRIISLMNQQHPIPASS